MEKKTSKYYETARLMDEALLVLLEKKDFAFITIKEICAKAGVNRSTFYLHYENTNDLLAETISMIGEYFSRQKISLRPFFIKSCHINKCFMQKRLTFFPIKRFHQFICILILPHAVIFSITKPALCIIPIQLCSSIRRNLNVKIRLCTAHIRMRKQHCATGNKQKHCETPCQKNFEPFCIFPPFFFNKCHNRPPLKLFVMNFTVL
ncbi:MAG: TetR/AcrR family transcriptional regulator [Peptococcaceae bacterium]|nr:TetR/AcrR family transcriptional regulator [Peptococcaceae bacterium]